MVFAERAIKTDDRDHSQSTFAVEDGRVGRSYVLAGAGRAVAKTQNWVRPR